MSKGNTLIVCESTGRWAAALRVALSQRGGAIGNSRVQEFRSLAELDVAINVAPAALILLEVRPNNIAAGLNWLVENWQRDVRAVALLGAELSPNQASEALLEAGALMVIDSPRRIGAAIIIAEKLAMSRSGRTKKSRSTENIAEWAWAALPWQDA